MRAAHPLNAWLDRAVHGVAMARFAVGSAWIFAAQTAVSLGLVIADASADGSTGVSVDTVTSLNLAFNVIYTLLYAMFVAAHWLTRKRSRPPLEYHLGVVLYTLGYAVFLAYHCLALQRDSGLDIGLNSCYVVGSLLFLLGSALLAHAASPFDFPPPLCSGANLQSAPLFAGSLLFLAGSVCFTADAIGADPGLARLLETRG